VKKHFRLGRKAASEWTCSVRAIRDTPVVDWTRPGVNTTHRIACRPPIAVSQFLLTLSVSYFKQTLWRCGQLGPYVGLCSLGTRLHQNSNAMGDAAKISPCFPSTSATFQSVQKPHVHLPDTPVVLTSTSKYFQILPDPPGALPGALRLCRSIRW
jgi:hypothetical protein